jgi:hypothetical protein
MDAAAAAALAPPVVHAWNHASTAQLMAMAATMAMSFWMFMVAVLDVLSTSPVANQNDIPGDPWFDATA